jgi:hypothetical protein
LKRISSKEKKFRSIYQLKEHSSLIRKKDIPQKLATISSSSKLQTSLNNNDLKLDVVEPKINVTPAPSLTPIEYKFDTKNKIKHNKDIRIRRKKKSPLKPL